MNNRLIWSLLCLSAIFSLLIIISGIREWVTSVQGKKSIESTNPTKQKKPVSFRKKLLVFSGLLILSVWCLRFSVGYYSSYFSNQDVASLGFWEEIFNSLIHTLQTFSLDEGYTEYISAGAAMMREIAGADSAFVAVYSIYASVLNFLAPIAGGAIIFDLLTEFFPKLRLTFANWCIWRDKYYFSELNDKSLALAKSIVASVRNSDAYIIFTDAYTDDEEEKSTERLFSAKTIGAICIKDDLMHISLGRPGQKNLQIFLIDEDENSNLQTLTSLLDKDDELVQRAELYVFSSDKKISHFDDEVAFIVNKKMEEQSRSLESNLSKEDREEELKKVLPFVIPIDGIRNMTTNLLMDMPLYEPIIDKLPDGNGEKILNVTILGSGVIGTEFFLAAYWCGQMLDCKLCLNVVSNEKKKTGSDVHSEGSFEGRINYINPDIFRTTDKNDDILNYNSKGEKSDPYFTFRYFESDVLSENFVSLLSTPFEDCESLSLLDSDYFIVALGTDEDNFSVADRLRQSIGTHHMYNATKNKTVISYVIYNSELCRALNKSPKRSYTNDSAVNNADIYMMAFGCLEDVYSAKNVFFEGISDSAYASGSLYEAQSKISAAEEKREKYKLKKFRDIYSYQADLAKRVHRKYREYSAGYHTVSAFTAENSDQYTAIQEAAERNYVRYILFEEAGDGQGGAGKLSMLHRLAWLEHRRWCAYMRTKGFRAPSGGYHKYYNLDSPEHAPGDHKFVSLKLHPCLIECGKSGIRAEFDNVGRIIKETVFTKDIVGDLLDELSDDRKKLNNAAADFKQWDYPEFEGFSPEEIAQAKKGESYI